MFLLAGAALGSPGPMARNSDGAWEFGAYFVNSKFDNTSEIANNQGFGVRAGYNLKAVHEVEIDLDSASGEHVSIQGINFDVKKYTINYVHNFLPKQNEKWVPLVTFGLGKINVDDGTDSINRTVLRAGGGFRYFFTPHVGLRLDAKIFRWRGEPPVTPPPSFFSFDATVGVTFTLGGAK
jgi:hypothetical protein